MVTSPVMEAYEQTIVGAPLTSIYGLRWSVRLEAMDAQKDLALASELPA